MQSVAPTPAFRVLLAARLSRVLCAALLAASLAARAQLRIVDTGVTEGVPGVAYPGYQLKAAGGTTPYTFSIAAGSLPAGLTLSAGGLLGGTPTVVGNGIVTFRVTDGASTQATKALSIAVNAPPAPSQWKLKALVGGPVRSVHLSPNYLTDGTAFARGQGREIYRTTDFGANWTRYKVTPDRLSRPLTGFALSPVFDRLSSATEAVRTVFAAEQCGVYKSIDHGQTFTPKTSGLPSPCNGGDVALSPNYAIDGTVWYAAYGSSFIQTTIYKSTNFGENWAAGATLSKPYSNPVSLMVVSPAYPADQTLMLLIPGYQGIYKSTNGGASFTGIPLAFSPFRLVFSPDYATDQTALASDSSTNLYRSTNGGASFPLLYTTPNLSGEGLKDVRFVKRASAPPLLLVKTDRSPYGVLSSDDYGDTFVRLYGFGLRTLYRSIMESDALLAAVRDGTTGALTIYAASGQGVELSDDSGRGFAARENGVSAHEAYNPAGGGAGLAIPAYGFWLLSGNRGAKFLARTNPGSIPGSTSIYLSPNYDTDGTLFIAISSVMYRSTDRGQTITALSGLGSPYSLSFSPDFNPLSGVAYAQQSGQGMVRTTDGGRTFSAVVSGAGCVFDASYNQVVPLVSPNYPMDGTVFANVQQTGVTTEILCRSSDFGATWSIARAARTVLVSISSVYDQRAANGTPQKTVLFSDGTGVNYRSTDGGASATAISGLTNCYGSVPFKFSPAFGQDGTVIKPCDEFGLYRSTDFGASFSLIPGAAGLLYYYGGLQLDPGFDGRNTSNSIAVLTTQGNGIWRSSDGARTFATVSAEGDIQSVDGSINQVAPGASGTLFAATAGQGVFRSDNGGGSFQPISSGLPPAANAEAVDTHAAAPANPVTAVKDQGLWRFNGASWTSVGGGTGRYIDFAQDGTYLYAARKDGVSMRSANAGQTWTTLDAAQGDLVNIDYNADGNFYLGAEISALKRPVGPQLPEAANTAPLWALSAANGPLYSANQGTAWTPAPGGNDYTLPAGLPWSVITALGLDAQTGGRIVVAATKKVDPTPGELYLSRDGGATWRKVSGGGSGLEFTSKDSVAVLNSLTPFGTLDLLVGIKGSLDGGVYLSGDGGEHWTQVNAGFDPANLSISSLIKTSCSGCPVQYYSGSYGGGMYTRTISVVPPPTFPSVNYSCYTGSSCSCATGAGSGPEQGGQAFTLCGGNFQNGAVVEFDGMPATGCTVTATTIGCTATPPHAPALVSIRVRNPDTRTAFLPVRYTYTTGSPRANNLYVTKAAGNANLSWSCPAATCTASAPARVYRAQNAQFSLFVENYNGGPSTVGGAGAFANTGAVATAQSYFWSVE